MIKIDAVGGLPRNRTRDWDDEGRSRISHIFISQGAFGIKSIQFQYLDSYGSKTLSSRYGANGGQKFEVVKLQAPTEIITEVNGNCLLNGCVTKLTFTTNLGTYGPFGAGHEKPDFEWKSGGDWKFGGFCGTSDPELGLLSLGMYLSSQ